MLTIEKCEIMGADAAENGVPLEACPFHPSVDEWVAWHCGYAAFYDFVLGISLVAMFVGSQSLVRQMLSEMAVNGQTVH